LFLAGDCLFDSFGEDGKESRYADKDGYALLFYEFEDVAVFVSVNAGGADPDGQELSDSKAEGVMRRHDVAELVGGSNVHHFQGPLHIGDEVGMC